MFKFLKPKAEPTKPQQQENKTQSWFTKLSTGLKRTRNRFSQGLANVTLGKKTIDDELFEALETLLLTADMGINITQQLLDSLTQQVTRHELNDPEALAAALQSQLLDLLTPYSQ